MTDDPREDARSIASATKPTTNQPAIQTRESDAVELEEEHRGEHDAGTTKRPAAGDAQQPATGCAERRRRL